jgi:hypothetical protein
MHVGDHVYLDDASGRNNGKVTTRSEDGICAVKWDSGITERVHESELRLADESYAQDDPKHPSFRERLAALWDSRPGK